MKTSKLIFCSCLVSFLLISCASSSTSQAEREKQQRVKETIDSRRYKIDVNYMNPVGAPSRALTSVYSLEIRNDSVISYLPYFGRAYSVPYGGGEGMNFTSLISEYNVKYDRRGKAEITFKTRNQEDNLTYRLSIFPNASATINVNPTQRQSISYQGNLTLP